MYMPKKKKPSILKEIREKKLPEIDYSSQKAISYSQLSMFNECPKKWSLQYREGHKQFTSSIHTVFGTALHEVLQHYLTVMYEKSYVEADKINTSEMLEKALKDEYTKQLKSNKNKHFSTPEELEEFHSDGVEILREFAKQKKKHFTKRGWHLVGCEVPIKVNPHKNNPNLLLQGFLDVVMYHEPTQSFKIIDIKTSRSGWNKKTKSDENKQFQLILYKKYFAELYNIPLEKIEVEFFIVKRKLYKSEDFIIRRIQTYTPPSGKVKMNKVTKSLNTFISEAFSQEGYKEIDHQPTPHKNCNWCPFNKTHLCSATS